MRTRLIVVAVAAALSVVLGAGIAASRSADEPRDAPNPLAEEVLLADRDGNALRCNGTLVAVRRSALGGSAPTLAPEQAAEAQAQARRGAPVSPDLISPSFRRFSCAKDARGEETGDALAHVTEPSGRTSTRTLENTND